MTELKIQTPAVFVPLLEPARYKGAYGGRGSGKSHFFAELAVEKCIMFPGSRIVCVREVQKTLKESAKRLIEDKIITLGVGHLFDVQNDRIKTPGDGIIIFQGMQDHNAESIKSLEGFDAAWVEEAQTMSERSLELLRPTIRADNSEIWFSWNPRNASDPVDQFLRRIIPEPNSIVIRANYNDNPFFPDVLEGERASDRKNRPDRYSHIWLGDYEPQAIGAIFNRQTIHENRIAPLIDGSREIKPGVTRERTVIAVDPAVSDTSTSDEHGISVCALGSDQRGYVIEDGSLHGSPHQWAVRAVALYDKWDADAIVIEKNQGGDMCRYTIETIRKNIRIIEVTATRGKHVRAEPISALYSLGKVSHAGTFPEIEDQLCKFTASGYDGDNSPDRAESVIWACTELFPKMTTEQSDSEERYYGNGNPGGWMG